MDTRDWRLCTIEGNMGSDSAAEQYPMGNVCGDCIALDAKRGEDRVIVGEEGPYDADYGSECVLECGMDAADED